MEHSATGGPPTAPSPAGDTAGSRRVIWSDLDDFEASSTAMARAAAERDIDPAPELDQRVGSRMTLDNDHLSDVMGTSIRMGSRPQPESHDPVVPPERSVIHPDGGTSIEVGDPVAPGAPVPVGPVSAARADQPQPIQPWRIGDPGRAFTEVQPRFEDTFDTPDTVLDGGQLGPLAVYAASARGLAHRQVGTPRQDAYGVGLSEDARWLVVAVADGVSAGRYSHRAAQLVARHAIRQVGQLMSGREALLPQADWYGVFQHLSQLILAAGRQKLKLPPEGVAEAMATTATILVCATDAKDGLRPVQVAWFGDSPAWLIEPNRNWRCLTDIKGFGQEVSSSAVAALPKLPEDPTKLSVREQMVPPQAVLLVMSDGVGDPLGDGSGQVGEALVQAWSGEPASALDFAMQVGFGRKGFDDDRTVVGVWDPQGSWP
jgi:serine/threonine protein phosphatase PrpC